MKVIYENRRCAHKFNRFGLALTQLSTIHTLQPAIWTTDAIGNSDHIYVTQNDR